MSRWPLAQDAELRILSHDDAGELFEVIERNRGRLGEYLPWVHLTHTVADVGGFLAGAAAQHSSGSGFHAGIFVSDGLVGCVGMHPIDKAHRNVAIGYWLDAAAEGRGLVTGAAGELVRICFADYGLHRVEIRCAVGNERSRAIPLRLGFQEEGILRGAQQVNGRWFDLHVFGRLAGD